VRLHIHFSPAEAHAFGFEPQPLLNSGIAAQLDLASGAEYALPRQSKTVAQNRRDLPRCPWKSRSPGDATVSGNLAAWNRPNRSLDAQA
jgi:hypothetical protein